MASSRTLSLFLPIFFLAVFFVPQSALAKECNPACGIGQTCDTTQGVCKPPITPESNPTTVSPGSSGDTSGTLLVNPLKGIKSLPDLLAVILKALVDIGTIVLILALVWVGFSYVRAQGKPEAIQKAHAALLWTIIGGAILLGAQAISQLIQSTVSSLS